ncbi:MAM domain-containing protein 2 [Coregonus clupeaformis]|uniref:MAM domain-containing protein 2 n=1 Tax=Coregonus clupeaformis TaxID=59861 RepID=UPI001E1C31CF|nr:MAM domain-containing protein 2 [Coregonus clupeaformis]
MLPFYLFTLFATVQGQNGPLPGCCSFESSTCGYTSDPDFTSWTLNKDGSFISVDTGLEYQNSQEKRPEGEERSEGESRGVLLSPAMEQEDWSCLRLVYQLSGSGSLQVQLRREGESFDWTLWSTQTASDSWLISSIDLQNTTEPYRIVIDGRPGESTGSSVAIFEIRISSGYCLECNYEESHLCGYRNQWNTNINWYRRGGAARDPQSNLPDDHTRSNGAGHYMYVDSVYAKTFQEVAKLVSPLTTVPMSGCLIFQYRRGEERGNLFSVYTRDQAGQYQDLWRSDPEDQNLNDWTNTTSEWIPVQVDIKAPYPLQVVFEVAFNSPRGGQVALDDITFSPEFCSAETEPTFDPSIANCDFEGGFCRYTQDQKEGSPWKRVSVKPNIYRTGDHTTGAGSFLLAHSRLNPRAGYISRLLGPLLPGNMKYCLRFHYSLHGFIQTDQALTVYLQDQSGITQERIWTQNDKSRGVWIATEITFQSPHVANVVFVSTCTNFWDCGSVALDDISVSLGDCDLTTGLLLSVPGHCNFETGHCGYIQDKEGDKGDWVLVRGPTPTSYTGPRGDHTTGVGYYMHIEASNMLPGQNARLFSSPLRGSRCPQCLRFFYHMYGSGTGELSIHLRKDGKDELLWKRTGEQSITWLRATVEYRSDQQHQIVFEAIRGSSIRSDIAIDNIVFESGPCPDIEVKMTHSSGNSNDIE